MSVFFLDCIENTGLTILLLTFSENSRGSPVGILLGGMVGLVQIPKVCWIFSGKAIELCLVCCAWSQYSPFGERHH